MTKFKGTDTLAGISVEAGFISVKWKRGNVSCATDLCHEQAQSAGYWKKITRKQIDTFLTKRDYIRERQHEFRRTSSCVIMLEL